VRSWALSVAALAPALLAVSPARAGPDWTLEVGAAGRARLAHIGAADYVTDIVPVVEATYGDWSFSLDDGAKWSAFRKGWFSAGPVAEYRQSFNDRLPRGAFRMHDVVEAGGFAEARTPVGVLEGRLRHALGGYDGWSADLSFDTGGEVARGLLLGAELRVSAADQNFTQEYFGLRPHAASRFGLPRFRDEDYISVGGQIMSAQALTSRTRLVAAISADRIVGELLPSPLLTTRNIVTVSVGMTYRFSPAPAGHAP